VAAHSKFDQKIWANERAWVINSIPQTLKFPIEWLNDFHQPRAIDYAAWDPKSVWTVERVGSRSVRGG
jgi:hypothetical protein